VHIVNVITRMIVGGPQQVTLLAGHFYKSRPQHRYTVVAGVESGAEGDYHHELDAAGIEWHPIPDLVRELRPMTDLRGLYALVRLFQRLRPDVVHTRSAKARLLGPLAARIAGVPVVLQTVHGWSFNNAVDRRRALFVQMERVSRLACDCSVFVSEQDLNEGIELGIVPRDALARGRAAIIRSGVDFSALARIPDEERATLRAELGAPPTARVVSLVQRLSEPKTPLVFVEAMKQVVAGRDDVRIWIVGDGKLREPTERAVGELGLSERTSMLGMRKDVSALLSASDVVVHSSLREGLPRVVLETLNVGTPLIATNVGGVGEVVKDGDNGLLVPPNDVARLAQAIARALDDPAAAAARAARGRGAIHPFSAERMLEEQHALYERLLDEKRRAPRRQVA